MPIHSQLSPTLEHIRQRVVVVVVCADRALQSKHNCFGELFTNDYVQTNSIGLTFRKRHFQHASFGKHEIESFVTHLFTNRTRKDESCLCTAVDARQTQCVAARENLLKLCECEENCQIMRRVFMKNQPTFGMDRYGDIQIGQSSTLEWIWMIGGMGIALIESFRLSF